jgi:hypothetical protein
MIIAPVDGNLRRWIGRQIDDRGCYLRQRVVSMPLVLDLVWPSPRQVSLRKMTKTRLEPHPRLPHLVGEFRLGCYVYVFAVPFSDLDAWDLLGFFADQDFRDTFRHYAAVPNWLQQDLSGQTPGKMTPQLRFVRRHPEAGRPETAT